ncbi:MAG: RdgB/HAM1 family non-canonical purine NTP pyrophosphatase [Elusimicrobia bacterium]|nr:RdgB/HAM1 family non-canonical purine NTP pyrophosphatase [Elusimicrobiota bacterium]
MPAKILLATRNRHKARELSAMTAASAIEFASLDEHPEIPETAEDAPTLEGNARKKASEPARALRMWTLAEDTGLEVEALGGAPGVLAARYAGPGCDFAANNAKLLAALEGVEPARRGARFRTVMALCDPEGRVVCEEGRLDGAIALAPRGSNGFGYDPVFVVEGGLRTLAEMTDEEKNRISHRRRALERMLPHLARAWREAALLLAFLLAVPGPAKAGRTEPGQETIWDQIMATQANRGMRAGSRHMDAQQYDLAEAEFEKAVRASPNDPTAHMLLGAAYYWRGKVEPALAEYRKAIELDGKNAQAWMLVGIAMAWKGEAAPAYEAFRKAGELDGSRADIQMNIGSIEETLGRNMDALNHFRKAVQLEPSHPLYHFQLGMLYRRLGRDGEAIESMKDALRLYGQYEDALLELGAAEERLGQDKAAMHSFRKAVALKSRDAVARFRLGKLLLQGGDRTSAREVFAEAFHLTPEGEGAGLQLSVAYTGGKVTSAAPGFGKPSSGRPPAEDPPDRNDPLDVFRRNLERIPLEQSAVMNVDVAMVPKPRLTKVDDAESRASLKKALEKGLRPDRPSIKMVRREYDLPSGSDSVREAQIKKILGDLSDVVKAAPSDSDVRLGMNLTYKRLADALTRRGDAQTAPKVSFQPRQVGNDMGLWVIGTGWMTLVEEMLPESGNEPVRANDADWWVATGLGYATVGDGQKAMTAFEAALQIEPKHEVALLGRGVASVMTGDEARAAADYRRVLQLNPKNRAASEGLKWLLRPLRKRP